MKYLSYSITLDINGCAPVGWKPDGDGKSAIYVINRKDEPIYVGSAMNTVDRHRRGLMPNPDDWNYSWRSSEPLSELQFVVFYSIVFPDGMADNHDSRLILEAVTMSRFRKKFPPPKHKSKNKDRILAKLDEGIKSRFRDELYQMSGFILNNRRG